MQSSRILRSIERFYALRTVCGGGFGCGSQISVAAGLR